MQTNKEKLEQLIESIGAEPVETKGKAYLEGVVQLCHATIDYHPLPGNSVEARISYPDPMTGKPVEMTRTLSSVTPTREEVETVIVDLLQLAVPPQT